MAARLERDAPERASWATFVNEQVAKKNAAKVTTDPTTKKLTREGIHRLYDGRTRSGKTTLCRIMTRMEVATLAIGTKPKDPSLNDYIQKEGFLRIDHWPPKAKELRRRGPQEQVKLLLWPELKEYGDLKKHRDLYRQAITSANMEGGWCIVIDEGFQVCRPGGLGLGEEVSEIAYGGAGGGTSLSIIVQRPRGVPVIIHESCHELYSFKTGNEDDIRALASYSGHSSREFADAIKALGQHQFIHAPMTAGQGDWQVTEVPKGWT